MLRRSVEYAGRYIPGWIGRSVGYAGGGNLTDLGRSIGYAGGGIWELFGWSVSYAFETVVGRSVSHAAKVKWGSGKVAPTATQGIFGGRSAKA